MTKTDARKEAKNILERMIEIAYYSLEDMQYDKYSDDEKFLIMQYINQYGETMAKSIGREYHAQ